MDRREAMALSGSGSYYIQRGMSDSGPATQSGLHGSPGMNPLPNPNVQFQSNIGGTNIGSTVPMEPSPSPVSPHGMNLGSNPSVTQSEPVKRKRGRPRKYGHDGAMALALSSSTRPGTITPTQKRGRGRPPGSGRKQQSASGGEWISATVGIGFTPHVITAAVGEDIATKIMSFSQQAPRAICILSANGAVSTVTLSQPSSGGSVTYEGRFEILRLSGSYLVPSEGGPRNRTGGLSVSLASPEGHVIGGGVGGMLIAASSVQVIVGSFISGGSKTRKNNRVEEAPEGVREMDHHAVENQPTPTSVPQSQNLVPSSMDMWTSSRPMDIRDAHIDIDLMRG